MLPRLITCTAVVALSACASRPAPAPEAIEPSSAWAGSVVDVVIRGTSFLPGLQLDFDRPSRSVTDSTFSLRLGDTPLEQVSYVDATTLRARVPGTLKVGTWPLLVVDPTGREGALDEAFTVGVEPLRLAVESAGAGIGAEVGDVTLRAGAMLGLSAVGRRDNGSFARDVNDAAWASTAGTLSDTAGASVAFVMMTPGTAVVTASHAVYGADSTGTLTVVPCSGASECADQCHSTTACTAGVCVLGPVDKDSDGDGYVDGRCPGGADCNDGSARASPAGVEGPSGSASCEDGLDNDCNGLVDVLDTACTSNNTAPVARLFVTPDTGIPGDLFSGDASASSDAEDAPSALTIEWDWNGNGSYRGVGPTSTYRFTRAGTWNATVRVTDTAGARSTTSVRVVITTPPRVVVTTQADENDPNATPVAPGGTGLSLREALTWTNMAWGSQTVEIPAGYVIRPTARLPSVGSYTTIVGNGAILDGSGLSGAGTSCLEVSGQNVRIDALEFMACAGWPLYVRDEDGHVTNCRFHDNGYGPQIEGSNNTFGPGNECWANGYAGVSVADDNLVLDNSVHDNPCGIVVLRGNRSRVVGNRVYANTGPGIDLQSQADDARVQFNTVHGNAGSGLEVANSASAVDARCNVFTSNGAWGLDAASARFAHLDANDLYQNMSGACRACSTLGPRSLAVDPQYTNAGARDFHPRTSSLVIDAAMDLGVDRNGSRSGDFDGTAPDMGAFEVR